MAEVESNCSTLENEFRRNNGELGPKPPLGRGQNIKAWDELLHPRSYHGTRGSDRGPSLNSWGKPPTVLW
jgi:hypothetical protein